MSAWVALSFPNAAEVATHAVATYWPLIEKDNVALVAIEITVAVLLMAGLNYLRGSLRDRALAEVARRAGLMNVYSISGGPVWKKIQNLKTHQGRAKHIMILGPTGYNTFVDPNGGSPYGDLEMSSPHYS